MFDLIFSGVQAYNQVGMFFAGLVCLGLAGIILGSSLYARVHAIRASGTIIGVLNENSVYFPVYRYTTADGQTHEAKSNTGSGSVRGKETGRIVPLMISAHNPSEATEAGNYLFDIIGLVLLIPGVWLAYTALTAYPVTRMTWIMGIALLVYAGERLHRIFTLKGQRISVAEWKKLHNIGSAGAVDLANVKPIETLATPLQQGARAQNSKLAGPLVGLFAIVLIAATAYQSVRVFRLATSGVRAEGEVVRMVEQSDSGGGGYTYYPVVRFRTADNRTIEFKDNIGSDPPTRRPGDKAAVLYARDNPAQAMIDRGFFNWVLPALLFLGAAFLVWLTVYILRTSKNTVAQNVSAGSVVTEAGLETRPRAPAISR